MHVRRCGSGLVPMEALYTAAISLGVCVQGVCTRVARVGGRCAVVWLTSECMVQCVLHMY